MNAGWRLLACTVGLLLALDCNENYCHLQFWCGHYRCRSECAYGFCLALYLLCRHRMGALQVSERSRCSAQEVGFAQKTAMNTWSIPSPGTMRAGRRLAMRSGLHYAELHHTCRQQAATAASLPAAAISGAAASPPPPVSPARRALPHAG